MSHQQPVAAATADVKERVRDAVDIVDVVGSYIALRRQGKAMVGLCPWHDDSRPSLQVNPERQTFRCWVCDVGGDVFNFVMRMERVEFREALEQLADRVGITLQRGRGGLPADAKAGLRTALEWAAARFRECLASAPEAAAARRYVTDRGLTAGTIDGFQLGFAPPAWDWLLRQASAAGIATTDLVRCGLAVERQDGSGHYDRFRGRVMFPIRDPQGRCVAFGGRILPGAADDAAKYINSPETALFSKSTTLYGLDTARDTIAKSRRAVVVEGYTDCLAARQAGVGDVVAVLGTALTARHATLLRRYADRIVLVLDGDDAGRRRADEVLDVLLAEPVDVRIARLPAGVDPCEFILERGRAAFDALVEAAGDPLEYRMEEAFARLAPGAGQEATLDAVESVLTALAAAASGSVDSERKLREDRVLGRLSRRFGLSREALRGRLLDLRRGRTARDRDREEPATTDVARPSLPAWDREVIEVLVGVPGSAGIVVHQVGSAGVESPAGRTVLAAAERLHAAGRAVGLGELLLEVADPALQSLLVGMAETGAARPGPDPQERFVHFEEALRRRTAARRARESALALEGADLDTETTAKLLERLVAERRVAQGIAEPKDG